MVTFTEKDTDYHELQERRIESVITLLGKACGVVNTGKDPDRVAVLNARRLILSVDVLLRRYLDSYEAKEARNDDK